MRTVSHRVNEKRIPGNLRNICVRPHVMPEHVAESKFRRQTSTSMSRLPQEVIDLIVDAISTRNRVDLSLVTLTSRVFLHQAQSHLFRSVKLEVSYCIQQNSEDLDAFHTILLRSPNIKFYIQEICVNGLVFCSESYHRTRSWPCPHHAGRGRQHQHFLSRKVVEKFHIRNIPRLFSIIPMLSRLRAIRINYGPKCRKDWRYALTRGGQTAISLFCFEQSITTLTLSSLINVPMAVMDSILQLSQLTTLIFDDVLLDDTESVLRCPRQSQLTNLCTFGFVRVGYYPGPPSVKDITEIAALIVRSTSQTLRKLIWSDQLEGKETAVTVETLNSSIFIDNVEMLQHLINLRTISTGAQERHYQLTLRSLIL